MEETDILGQIPHGTLLRDVVEVAGDSSELLALIRGSEYPFLLISPRSSGENGREGFNTTRYAREELQAEEDSRLSKKLEWLVFVVCKRSNSNAFMNMITFGRAQNNDIIMSSSVVSKFHASFTRKEGVWVVKDHNSSNGTKVQGRKLEEDESFRLTGGESLRLGSHKAEFLSSENLASTIEVLCSTAEK